MGHVDHGKTSLLDAIRKTSVAAKETGGITQHIGSYQIQHKTKTITFIDTPGHAAFSAMRSRGAQATDIVILVVSAAEGVKPQTVESIQHIKKAGVQYLVALTKMDLPDANPEMVKAQLTEREVFVEGYGGDIVCVPVSAKKGEGLDKLLEMVLLIAELAELKADPVGALQGVVIESKRDAHRGTLATILVKNGTLRVGDTIFAEHVEARVRTMQTADGVSIKEAVPSMPVEIVGWEGIPKVGSSVTSTKQEVIAIAPAIVPELPAVSTAPAVQELPPVTGLALPTAVTVTPVTVATPAPEEKEKPKLKIILKSDTVGTLEAIQASIAGDEILTISSGVGEINDADVLMAESTGARILGFNVKAASSVKKIAETHGVKLKTYTIIYDLIEDVQKQALKLIEPTIDEEELGSADVIAVFEMKGERIAGCKIKTGEITKTQLYHIKRGGEIIANPKIKSIHHNKLDIESAKAGTDCGIVFRGFSDAQIGDLLTSYRVKDE